MESKATNYELPIVRVQLIRDQPIISERQISNTVDASEVIIELMADSDREMFCVLNLRSDGTPHECERCFSWDTEQHRNTSQRDI